MVAFVKEYVFVREIPIPKLLHAFGVNLVGVQSIRSSLWKLTPIPCTEPGALNKTTKHDALLPKSRVIQGVRAPFRCLRKNTKFTPKVAHSGQTSSIQFSRRCNRIDPTVETDPHPHWSWHQYAKKAVWRPFL